MNIKNFASTPKLIEISLDDESLLETYGEPITFYTYDTVSLSTYFDFYNAKSNSEFANLEKILHAMVLDDKGNKVLQADEDLPVDIAAAAITKIGTILGKSLSKPSTSTVGEQPK